MLTGDLQTVVIAINTAVSSVLDISILPYTIRGLSVLVPSAWTAADIGFQVSEDNSTFYPLYDASGARVKIASIATLAARLYGAPADAWHLGVWPYVRLESLNTSTGAALNQAAERTLKVNLVV